MECQKVRNPERNQKTCLEIYFYLLLYLGLVLRPCNTRQLLRSDRIELTLLKVFNEVTIGFGFLEEKWQILQPGLKGFLGLLLPENIVVVVLSVPCPFRWEFILIEFSPWNMKM